MTGFTQLPNWLIEAMPQMPASVFQVAIVIARQTIGYKSGDGGRREWQGISLADFAQATGLSRQGVINALSAGMGRWFERRRAKDSPLSGRGQILEYRLVNLIDQYQSTELTNNEDIGQPSVPIAVNSVDQYQSTELTNSHLPKERNKERERESTRTRGELADRQAARIVHRDHTGVEPRLLTTLTNHVKRISGYGYLVDHPGDDALEDQLRDDAYRLYNLGFNSDEMMLELEQAWKSYSAGFANKMPGKDQLYKTAVMVASGTFRQATSSNGASAAGMTLIPMEAEQ